MLRFLTKFCYFWKDKFVNSDKKLNCWEYCHNFFISKIFVPKLDKDLLICSLILIYKWRVWRDWAIVLVCIHLPEVAILAFWYKVAFNDVSLEIFHRIMRHIWPFWSGLQCRINIWITRFCKTMFLSRNRRRSWIYNWIPGKEVFRKSDLV